MLSQQPVKSAPARSHLSWKPTRSGFKAAGARTSKQQMCNLFLLWIGAKHGEADDVNLTEGLAITIRNPVHTDQFSSHARAYSVRSWVPKGLNL